MPKLSKVKVKVKKDLKTRVLEALKLKEIKKIKCSQESTAERLTKKGKMVKENIMKESIKIHSAVISLRPVTYSVLTTSCEKRHISIVPISLEKDWPEKASDVTDTKNIKLEQPDELVIEKLLCRCCHAEGQFISLQDTDPVHNVTYEDMLATSHNIQLFETEVAGPLRALCGPCTARLRDAHAFCQQVRACEERFRTLYSKNCVKVASTVEIKVKKESPVNDDVTSVFNGDGILPDKIVEDKVCPKQHNNTRIDAKPLKKPALKRRLHKKLPKLDLPASVIKEYVLRLCGDRFQCKQCGKVFRSVGNFHEHVNVVHLKVPYQCQLCYKPFINEALRMKHKLEEHNVDERTKRSYPCDLCKKPFNTNAQRKQHKLKEHDIDERYKCNACDKVLLSAQGFAAHLKTYHMMGEKFKCGVCDYESYSKGTLQKHMFKHKTSKDFQCKYCKKSFMRKTTMQFHERIHTGDKRKVCAECGQAFVQKASLNYHMMKYHPEVKF